MDPIKEKLLEWNRNKWELKNRKMYEVEQKNTWPWFSNGLDVDVLELINSFDSAQARILDLGTCSGTQAIELARLGHSVVGTDISESALAKAIANLKKEQALDVEFLFDDITTTALPENEFDFILDRGCFHSICTFANEIYQAQIKRLLKPGALLLLKTMSSDEARFVNYDKIGNASIQMPYHFKSESLRNAFAKNFDVLDVKDSYFYSDVVDPPAKARFAIIRKP